MPLYIDTHNPAGLLKAIKNKIDTGDIATWAYVGDRFEYLAKQYHGEAFLDATVELTRLYFRLKWKPAAQRKTFAVMAIFYGRFTEEILSHFTKKSFSRVYALPLR